MNIDAWPKCAGVIALVANQGTSATALFILTAVILAFVAWTIIWSGHHRR